MSARAWAELSLLALIWGGSFFSIAVALREIGPLTVVAHRTFWAALMLLAAMRVMGLRLPRDRASWAGFALMGLLNNVVPFGLMAWGTQHMETGLVSIFNATAAIFGAVVAALVLPEERLTARRVAGLALGFGGVVAIIGVDAAQGFDVRSAAQGAVALGALSYAVASVYARARLRHVAPQAAATGMLVCSAAMSLPLAVAAEGWPTLELRPETWGAIAWFAAAGTAGAYLLYYRVLGMAGAGNLQLVTLMIPPISIGLGAAFLGERLGWEAGLGFALVAAGLAVIDGRALARLRRGAGARGARLDRGGGSA
jgi:drug/metabolite transporter (DMT)-like permease